MKENLL